MAEYIEREAVCNDCANRTICVDKSKCTVGRAHAADVVEVVHGEWIKNEDDCWWEGSESRFCSCCGQGINVECIPWFKFCPNCGAKMDGGTHNE